MRKGRNWTAEDKAKIVVQGLKGRAVSEICNEYQIHQTQYYRWREQFLENIPKVFEARQQSRKEERLERENHRLKTVVGELTMELKKMIGDHSPKAKWGNRTSRRSYFVGHRAAQSGTSILRLSQNLGVFDVC